MKVEGTSKTTPKAKIKKKSNIGDSSFSDMVQNAEQTSSLNETTQIQSIEPTETVNDALSGKSPTEYTKEHATNILEQLETLQMELITGSISGKSLQKIANTIKHYKNNIDNDPELENILNDINLRAEVELAKYTRIENI